MCVITYNQKDFISNCLDSVLEQRLNENYNIIVCDDSSTDGTSKLITENYSRFKNVCIHINKENFGVSNNFLKCINQSDAKYIAICEGDDFWNDPFKLRKQVDILEKNQDCSFCFTDVNTLQDGKIIGVHPNLSRDKQKFTGIELADQPGSIAQTCTLVIRREYLENLPDWVLKSYTLDWCLQLYLSTFGPGLYLPEVTATYRIHDQGIWSKLSPFEGWRKNYQFYKIIIKTFRDLKYKRRLRIRIINQITQALELAINEFNSREIKYWFKLKLLHKCLKFDSQTVQSLRILLLSLRKKYFRY